jgi:hypothetical protein
MNLCIFIKQEAIIFNRPLLVQRPIFRRECSIHDEEDNDDNNIALTFKRVVFDSRDRQVQIRGGHSYRRKASRSTL